VLQPKSVVLRRNKTVLWRRAVDGILLLSPGNSVPAVLDASGAAVWDLLEEPRTTESLILALAARYVVTPSRIAEDVVPFLDELVASGVLHRDEQQPA
jgi:hypothetical protein